MKEMNLPSYAKVVESPHSDSGKVSVVIEVDPSVAYPLWVELLSSEDYPEKGLQRLDAGAGLDQYWLETIYQCTKLDVQAALVGTEYDLNTAGKPVELHFKNCPEYALKEYKVGRGIGPATKDKEARKHYIRVRGSLPF